MDGLTGLLLGLIVGFIVGLMMIAQNDEYVFVHKSSEQFQVYYNHQNYRLVPCYETECK